MCDRILGVCGGARPKPKCVETIVYSSRFVRAILAQGPCESSLYRSNFNGSSPKGIQWMCTVLPKFGELASSLEACCCLSWCGFHSLKISCVRWNAFLAALARRAMEFLVSVVEPGPNRSVWKNSLLFSICACHPCAGAVLIFSVSFQF